MKKNISLLVPSRGRLNLKLTLISSIVTTIQNSNNIELVFGIDDDDDTKPIVQKIANNIPFIRIVDIHNNGKFIGINKIWNILASTCNCEIYGYLGDDFQMMTPDWDIKILEEFNNQNLPSDGIKLVHCYDGHRNGDLCTNAFIGKKYVEIIGYLCREEFLINYSDSWLYQSFSAFNRIKYRPDITMHHNHWIYKDREIDKTAKRMLSDNHDKISDNLWKTLRPELHNDIKKLGKYLNIEPDWSKVDL